MSARLESQLRAVARPLSATTNEGTQLIAEVEKQLRRFVYLPNDQDYTTVTLWAVTTHAMDLFDIAPRLALHSPVPGCGKSTLFRILKPLVRRGQIEINPTEAGLFRDMDQNHPTVLFDEMDKYLGHENAVTAVLNAGHARGVTVKRCMGEDYTPTHYNVFGPVAFALKDRQLPADLADRSLRVEMKRVTRKLERFKEVLHASDLDALGKQIADWVADNRERLMKADPVFPPGITNRAADNWLPLLAIAEAAGGKWPDAAEAAALAYESSRGLGDHKLVLLADIKRLFEEKEANFYASLSLCDDLNEREEWQWGTFNSGSGLTPHLLARLLRPFEITPTKKRVPDIAEPVRGYARCQFDPVWEEQKII